MSAPDQRNPSAVDSDLVDAAGVEHEPAGADARIVSLVPSITELLFDLGLGRQVVGRTAFCIHPGDAIADVPRVGGTKNVKIARLRELQATHVIANVDENTRSDVDAIAEFVPHVVVTDPVAVTDNLRLFRLIGGIFGREEEARQLCGEFAGAYERLCESAVHLPARNVIYLIWREPWMTVSRATYCSRMLSLAKLNTLGDDPATRYPELTLTPELLAAADAALFATEPYRFDQRHLDEFRAMFPMAGQALSLIDGEMVSWYGSRAIQGLHYLEDLAPRLGAG